MKPHNELSNRELFNKLVAARDGGMADKFEEMRIEVMSRMNKENYDKVSNGSLLVEYKSAVANGHSFITYIEKELLKRLDLYYSENPNETEDDMKDGVKYNYIDLNRKYKDYIEAVEYLNKIGVEKEAANGMYTLKQRIEWCIEYQRKVDSEAIEITDVLDQLNVKKNIDRDKRIEELENDIVDYREAVDFLNEKNVQQQNKSKNSELCYNISLTTRIVNFVNSQKNSIETNNLISNEIDALLDDLGVPRELLHGVPLDTAVRIKRIKDDIHDYKNANQFLDQYKVPRQNSENNYDLSMEARIVALIELKKQR